MTIEYGANGTLTGSKADADAALIAKLGGTWFRTSIEQGAGASALNPFRTACDNHGLKLWNCCQASGHKVPRTAAAIDAFATYVAQCAKICDATGVGNEVNGFGSNETADQGQIDAWATVMVACIAKRDAIAPGKWLSTPELEPGSGAIGHNPVEPLTWFKAFVTSQPTILNASNLYIGWHGYCDGRFPAGTQQTWNQAWRMRALHDYLVTKGKGSLKIASTEWGAHTGPPNDSQKVSEAAAAQDMVDYDAEFVSQEAAGVQHGPMIWYQLRNIAGATDWTGFSGLVNTDGTTNLIGKAFTKAAGGSSGGGGGGTGNNFPLGASFGAGIPAKADVDAAITAGVEGFRCGFIDWDTGDPNFNGTFTSNPRWDASIAYMNAQTTKNGNPFEVVLQVSLGATFGGKEGNDDYGQGYNHAGRAHKLVNGVDTPFGPVVDVPVQLSKFVVNVIKYFDGNGGRPLVKKFEIFNEVNHFRFDDGIHSGVAADQKGAAYLEYLARIYPAAKTARPDATIITSGLGGHKETVSDRDPTLFTQDLFQATFTLGGHTYSMSTDTLFDFYCYHPYYYFSTITDPNQGWAEMVATQAWLASHGFCTTKFYITEWSQPIEVDGNGNPTGPHTLQQSADAMKVAFADWNTRPWGGAAGMPLFWFQWQTSSGGHGAQKGKDYGLLNRAGNPNGVRYDTYKAQSLNRNPNPPPSTTCLSPVSGLVGTTVTVNGTFLTGASVTLGGVACTSVVVAAGGLSLTCVTPAHAAGTGVPVVVTTSHGSSVALDFQVKGTTGTNPPTVSGLSVSTGPIGGNTKVVLTGTNFNTVNPTNTNAVMYGQQSALSFSVDSATQITSHSPAVTHAGDVGVTVTNPDGTSTAVPFTYTSSAPVSKFLAMSLDDGTVYTDFSAPVVVNGTFGVAWSASDDSGIASTAFAFADGSILANGVAANGIYGAQYNSLQLLDGTYAVEIITTDTDQPPNTEPSPLATIIVANGPKEIGLFASPFYTIYTIPGDQSTDPNVTIISTTPNPIPPGAS